MEPRPDRREQILRESLHLFAVQGIDGTGMRDIARRVGITQPTLYHYFPSKEELIQALIDWRSELAAHYQEHTVAHVLESITLRQVLQRLVDGLVSLHADPDNIAFLKMLFSELARGGPLAARLEREFIRPRRERAARMFRTLIDAGRIRDLDPELLAFQFIGPLFFAMLLKHSGQDASLSELRMRELIFQHMETFIRGLERP